MNDSIPRYSISSFHSTSSVANFPFSFPPFRHSRASFDCLLKRKQLLCTESDVLISSIQMGSTILYVKMQELERGGESENLECTLDRTERVCLRMEEVENRCWR